MNLRINLKKRKKFQMNLIVKNMLRHWRECRIVGGILITNKQHWAYRSKISV